MEEEEPPIFVPWQAFLFAFLCAPPSARVIVWVIGAFSVGKSTFFEALSMRKVWERAGQPFRNMFDATGIVRMGKKAPNEFAAMYKEQVPRKAWLSCCNLHLTHRREFVRGFLTHASDARRVEHIPERLARLLPRLPHRKFREEAPFFFCHRG